MYLACGSQKGENHFPNLPFPKAPTDHPDQLDKKAARKVRLDGILWHLAFPKKTPIRGNVRNLLSLKVALKRPS